MALSKRGYLVGIVGFLSPAYLPLALKAFSFDAPNVMIYCNGPVARDLNIQIALVTAKARGCILDTRPIKGSINNGDGPAKDFTIEFEERPSATVGMLIKKSLTRNRAQNCLSILV